MIKKWKKQATASCRILTRYGHFSLSMVVAIYLCFHSSKLQGVTFLDQTMAYFGQMLPGTTGVSWADFNNDGFVDLAGSGYLWQNNGGTGFTHFPGWGGYKLCWADFNNDGNLDCVQTLSATPVQLFLGNGSGSFSQVSLPSLPGSNFYDSATLLDIDGDGFVDLYLAAESNYKDVMLHNNSGNSFSISWTQPVGTMGRGVTSCDFDEDIDMDIYVSNYLQQPNPLFRNNGSGIFSDVATSYGVAGDNPPVSPSHNPYGHTVGSCWGDLDNDGHFDLFVGNFNHHDSRRSDESKFLRNRGPASGYTFELKNELDGADWQESYVHPTLGDYDNDGDLDLFITTVYPIASGGVTNAARLFRNDGNWNFTNVTTAEGLGGLNVATYQAAWADIDNDGDLDLATAGKLYVNQGNANHWVKLRMVGNGYNVNSSAIGAQVRIAVNGQTLTRQVESGTGSGNQNDLALHFGLGSHNASVDLQITWPDGETQVVPNVAIDQVQTISQSDGSSALFEDRFYNLNKWTHVSSSNPATIASGLASGHEPYMHVEKGTMRAELPEALTNFFVVKFKWRMDDWGDYGYLWLMNAAGTDGYGVRFNAGQDSEGNRGGHINIMKYDSSNEYDYFRQFTELFSVTQLLPTATTLSGNSTEAPFAAFEFSWSQATGELKVKVTDWIHGVHEISVTDTDFSSFSRIYTTTTTNGHEFYLDDLQVNPEPSTLICQDMIDDGYGVPSDLNSDCSVNLIDWAMFIEDWNRCNNPDDIACEETW